MLAHTHMGIGEPWVRPLVVGLNARHRGIGYTRETPPHSHWVEVNRYMHTLCPLLFCQSLHGYFGLCKGAVRTQDRRPHAQSMHNARTAKNGC